MAEAMRAARRLGGPCSSGWILVAALWAIPGPAGAAPTTSPAKAPSATSPAKAPSATSPAKAPSATSPAKAPSTTPASTPTTASPEPTAGSPTSTGSTSQPVAPTRPTADTQEEDEIGAGSSDNDGDGNTPVIARAGLEIDTAKAGPSGPVMLSRLEELGNLELRRAEILPRRAGDDPVIHVKVEVRGEEGDTYAIFSEVRVRDKAVEGSAARGHVFAVHRGRGRRARA